MHQDNQAAPPASIPARLALIGWHLADGHPLRVTRVVVIHQEPDQPDTYLGPQEWQDVDCTQGACEMEWMEPGSPHMTSAGVFASLLADYGGFASEKHLLAALHQFGRIKGCGWARTMAATITHGIGRAL